MTMSDWISLAACVAAFIALIPSYAPMLEARRGKRKGKGAPPSPTALESPPEPSARPVAAEQAPEPKKLNAFGKALVLSAMGLCIGVIELVLFSFFAAVGGVAIDLATMPITWQVAFYAIFIVPGICLFWAAAHLFNLFE